MSAMFRSSFLEVPIGNKENPMNGQPRESIRRAARLVAIREHDDFLVVYRRLWMRAKRGKPFDYSAPHQGTPNPLLTPQQRLEHNRAACTRYYRKLRRQERESLAEVRKGWLK